MAHIKIN